MRGGTAQFHRFQNAPLHSPSAGNCCRKMPFAKRDPASPASGGQVMPTGAFDEGTMYRSSYVTKEIVAPTQFKPAVRPAAAIVPQPLRLACSQ